MGKLTEKLRNWDGTKRLTAKEYSVMCSMESKTIKKQMQSLKQQRLKTLLPAIQAVVFVPKAK